jgi:hypothetical protein
MARPSAPERLVTPEQIERIYQLTDTFSLKRDAVVVPLVGRGEGMEMILPDGKLLVRPPPNPNFEPWFVGLAGRLVQLDLSRTARVDA